MDNTFQIFKTALAAAVSWWAAYSLLQGPYPYFAPLAAILTIQVTISESVKKAWQRLIGTIGGVIVSTFISHWLSINISSIFLVIAIGMLIGSLLRLPPYINSQAAISSLMVLAFSQSQGYALGRILETIIGSLIGILVNAFIIPPNAIPKAEKHILLLSKQASLTLESLGTAIQKRAIGDKGSPLMNVTNLGEKTLKGIYSIQLAEESLKFNPFMSHQRWRMAELSAYMKQLEHISTQILGIRRGLIDLCANLTIEIELDKLQTALKLTAICINNFGNFVVDPLEEPPDCLAKSVEEAMSAQLACLSILLTTNSLELIRQIGAILTDLHRILREVSTTNLT